MESFVRNIIHNIVALYNVGYTDLSIRCFGKLLSSRSMDIEYRLYCYTYIVLVHYQFGNYNVAIDYAVNGLVESGRKSDILHFMLGISAAQINNYKIAEKHFKVCGFKGEHQFYVLYNLGVVQQLQHNYKAAMISYIMGSKIEEKCGPLWFNLSICAIHKKQYAFAEQCVKKAIDFGYKHVKGFYILGILYMLCCKFRRAALLLTQGQKDEEGSIVNCIRIILCWICSGSKNKAIKELRRVFFNPVIVQLYGKDKLLKFSETIVTAAFSTVMSMVSKKHILKNQQRIYKARLKGFFHDNKVVESIVK